MACHPDQPFTPEQESRIREIVRDEVQRMSRRNTGPALPDDGYSFGVAIQPLLSVGFE